MSLENTSESHSQRRAFLSFPRAISKLCKGVRSSVLGVLATTNIMAATSCGHVAPIQVQTPITQQKVLETKSIETQELSKTQENENFEPDTNTPCLFRFRQHKKTQEWMITPGAEWKGEPGRKTPSSWADKRNTTVEPQVLFPTTLPRKQALDILLGLQREEDTYKAMEEVYQAIQKQYPETLQPCIEMPSEHGYYHLFISAFADRHNYYVNFAPTIRGEKTYPVEIGNILQQGTVDISKESYTWDATTTMSQEVQQKVAGVLKYMSTYLEETPEMRSYFSCPTTVTVREATPIGSTATLAGFYGYGRITTLNAQGGSPIWQQSNLFHEFGHACTKEMQEYEQGIAPNEELRKVEEKREFLAIIGEMSFLGEVASPAERGVWLYDRIADKFNGTVYSSTQKALRAFIAQYVQTLTATFQEEDKAAMPELITNPDYLIIPTFYARKDFWNKLHTYMESLCPTECVQPSTKQSS